MNESNIQYQFSLGNGLFLTGGPAGDGAMLISVRLGLTLVILQGGEASYYINQKSELTRDCCSGGLGPGVHLPHRQHHRGGRQRRPVHLRGQQLGGTQGWCTSVCKFQNIEKYPHFLVPKNTSDTRPVFTWYWNSSSKIKSIWDLGQLNTRSIEEGIIVHINYNQREFYNPHQL